MRKFQKTTAVVMAAVLAATGRSVSGIEISAPQQPSGTEAARADTAAGADKTEATKDTASGEEESVLVVYTTRSEALNNATIPEFEKDTRIRVEAVMTGTGELLRRAQSEKNNPPGDIFWVADQTMLSSSKELFMEYASSENKNMLGAFRNTIGYFAPAFVDPTVVTTNKNLKDDTKIDNLEGLLNPELKGKIAFDDPVNPSSAPQSLLAILYDMGKDGDPLSDQAWDYVNQSIADLDGKMANSSSQAYKDVTEGEYVMGLIWEDPVVDYVKEGATVEMVFPKEGIMFLDESVWILKDCEHPENVKKSMDYMPPERIQNVVGLNLAIRPLRKGAKLADYMTPQSEIRPLDNYGGGWVTEHKTEVTNPFSEHMETFVS